MPVSLSRASGLPAALVLLAFGAGCSIAPEIAITPTNRVVLAEFFTWARCSYCPYAIRALDSVARELGDSLVVISLHRRVAGDTMSPDYVEERRAFYYESGGEPATVFDGGEVVRTQGPEYNYTTFRNYTLAAKSVSPLAQLEITAGYDSLGLDIAVCASGVDSTPADTLGLFVLVIEDSIRCSLPGATDSIFNSVMREMLPDVTGRPILLSRGDTVEFHESCPVKDFWKRNLLGIVAFVQDPVSGRVLQAAHLPRIPQTR